MARRRDPRGGHAEAVHAGLSGDPASRPRALRFPRRQDEGDGGEAEGLVLHGVQEAGGDLRADGVPPEAHRRAAAQGLARRNLNKEILCLVSENI